MDRIAKLLWNTRLGSWLADIGGQIQRRRTRAAFIEAGFDPEDLHHD